MPKGEMYRPWHVVLQAENGMGALWLGDYHAALDKRALNENGIKSVVTAAGGLKVTYKTDISHMVLQLRDAQNEDIYRYFEEAHRFIEEGLQKGSVLVHCFAGVSRSSTIVISYLMKKFGWGVSQAYSFTKKKRKYIDPNRGFVKQLKRLQRDLDYTQVQTLEQAKFQVTESKKQQFRLRKTIKSKNTSVRKFHQKVPDQNNQPEVKMQEKSKTNAKSLCNKSPLQPQDSNRIYFTPYKPPMSLRKKVKLPQIPRESSF